MVKTYRLDDVRAELIIQSSHIKINFVLLSLVDLAIVQDRPPHPKRWSIAAIVTKKPACAALGIEAPFVLALNHRKCSSVPINGTITLKFCEEPNTAPLAHIRASLPAPATAIQLLEVCLGVTAASSNGRIGNLKCVQDPPARSEGVVKV